MTDERDPIEPTLPRTADVTGGPRVRTLLVCDLADSTALVERLGDSPAAELIRRHDRVARDLMQRYRGREIDKTDGFLVLFDRPVEAVAFALTYQRALRELGEETRQALRARVGVHVGEVVVWENPAADVAAGAKRLDVEGLAKPVVSRLMALAMPGQIILSGIAFSLAQRAEAELEGFRGVRWLTHGRYRFKGVAAPMLVHEVGEPGIAPLHAPPSGPKAEREVPLWRRPGVLALEAAALFASIAIPLGLSLRAPPAIAFGERDWIVMGDLRNLTGEAVLDDSLETAFRISLEQSRYVNVLPDLKLRDALARMQRAPDTDIDRAVASEIALREGARAVILPTVAEIGGRVRVSAEVIDPHTQTTVYAESADGVGATSALDSIDSVTHQLRARLGEALAAISNDSAPLPKVTSGNIEALRAYSLGERAYAAAELEQARRLFEEALRLDPDFALARTGLARVDYRTDHLQSALDHARRALALEERLTPRDRLYVSAWAATFAEPADAVRKWELLARMYPDHHNAVYNLSLYQFALIGRPDLCIETARRIDIPQYPHQADAVYMEGTCLLAANDAAAALQRFDRAQKLGVVDSVVLHAGAYAAQRDFTAAVKRLGLEEAQPVRAAQADRSAMLAATLVDRGRLADAVDQLRGTAGTGPGAGDDGLLRHDLEALIALTRGIDGLDDGERTAYRELIARAVASIKDDAPQAGRPVAFALLALGVVAARDGDVATARAALDAVAPADEALRSYPLHAALRATLDAELSIAAGRPADALRTLDLTSPPWPLLQQHVTRVRALIAAERWSEARQAATALSAMRARAYGEASVRYLLRILNVATVDLALLDLARIHLRLGETGEARLALGRFDAHWPATHWTPALAERVAALRSELAAR